MEARSKQDVSLWTWKKSLGDTPFFASRNHTKITNINISNLQNTAVWTKTIWFFWRHKLQELKVFSLGSVPSSEDLSKKVKVEVVGGKVNGKGHQNIGEKNGSRVATAAICGILWPINSRWIWFPATGEFCVAGLQETYKTLGTSNEATPNASEPWFWGDFGKTVHLYPSSLYWGLRENGCIYFQ